MTKVATEKGILDLEDSSRFARAAAEDAIELAKKYPNRPWEEISGFGGRSKPWVVTAPHSPKEQRVNEDLETDQKK